MFWYHQSPVSSTRWPLSIADRGHSSISEDSFINFAAKHAERQHMEAARSMKGRESFRTRPMFRGQNRASSHTCVSDTWHGAADDKRDGSNRYPADQSEYRFARQRFWTLAICRHLESVFFIVFHQKNDSILPSSPPKSFSAASSRISHRPRWNQVTGSTHAHKNKTMGFKASQRNLVQHGVSKRVSEWVSERMSQ